MNHAIGIARGTGKAVLNVTLPHDVIIDILSRLPVKSIVRFRCVCKLWRTLFCSPDFIRMHLKRSKDKCGFIIHAPLKGKGETLHHFLMDDEGKIMDINALKIVTNFTDSNCLHMLTSCNGLVCFEGDSDGHMRSCICICNPSTREFVMLSEPTPSCCSPFIGLGFDPSTMEHKVVRIYCSNIEGSSHVLKCEVFTLGSDSWRGVGAAPSVTSNPIFMGGALYWIGYLEGCIFLFDIRDEKFKVIPLPTSSKGWPYPQMVEIKGSFSLLYMNRERMDIWILKDQNNVVWVKEYSDTMPRLSQWFPWGFNFIGTQNGELLLLASGERGFNLVSYNLDLQRPREVDFTISDEIFYVDAHVESIISCKYVHLLKKSKNV